MSTKSIDDLQQKGGLLTDKSSEFAKLNQGDKLVCLDVLEKNRKDLEAWIGYTSRSYKANGIEINIVRLVEEISKFEEYANVMDNLSKEYSRDDLL